MRLNALSQMRLLRDLNVSNSDALFYPPFICYYKLLLQNGTEAGKH